MFQINSAFYMWPELKAGSFLNLIDTNETKEAAKVLHMLLNVTLRRNFI